MNNKFQNAYIRITSTDNKFMGILIDLTDIYTYYAHKITICNIL